MPTLKFNRIRAYGSFGLAAIGICLAGGNIASAQSGKVYSPTQSQGDIRAGIFFPVGSTLQKKVDSSFPVGGADFVIQRSGISQDTIVSVDYIDRAKGGNHIQVIPVTVGQVSYSSGNAGSMRTYVGYGAGVYFVDQSLPDSNGDQQSNHNTTYGGYFNVGADLTNSIFIDARYHLISKVGPTSASGIEVTGGFRF